MFHKVLATLPLIAAGLMLPFAARAAPVVIDDFEFPSATLAVGGTGGPLSASSQTGTNTGPTGIIGNYRDMWVAIDQSITYIPQNQAKFLVADGALSLSNDTGVDSGAIVDWDGDDLPPTGTNGLLDPMPKEV